MTIYYVLYASLFIGAALKNFFAKNEKNKHLFCFFAFLLIAGMLALRHPNMGIDLAYGSPYGYLGNFETIGSSDWQHVLSGDFANYEKGYVVFCKFISYFGNNDQVLLIACAIISTAAFSWFIYKYSCNCLVSFVVWMGLPVFLANFSALRQVIAIAITVFAFKCIKDKKILPFILLVLLASTFHKSAILFLVAYPAYYLRVPKKMQLLLAGALPVIYFLRYPLFNLFSKILKDDAVPDDNNAITLFLVFAALYVFLVMYSDASDGNGMCNLFWLACCCQALGGVYSTAIRVGYYFMVYLILLLPHSLDYMKRHLKDADFTHRFFLIVILLAFTAFGLYSLYTTYWSMSYPYYFCWQKYLL